MAGDQHETGHTRHAFVVGCGLVTCMVGTVTIHTVPYAIVRSRLVGLGDQLLYHNLHLIQYIHAHCMHTWGAHHAIYTWGQAL